eukprot:6639644-Prorocentrum_lima.AAC.1
MPRRCVPPEAHIVHHRGAWLGCDGQLESAVGRLVRVRGAQAGRAVGHGALLRRRHNCARRSRSPQ